MKRICGWWPRIALRAAAGREGRQVVLLCSAAVARSRARLAERRPAAATRRSRRRRSSSRPGAQQIAIAVENGLAYREIAELKEKLSKEKLYLEEEIRTDVQLRRDRRREPAAQAGAAAGRDCRADRLDRPDPGRDRHRQGADRPRDPRPERPPRTDVRQAQLRRHPHRPAGERALRPREGRVHRRDRAEGRPLRAGQRRDAVPRRGRRHPARAAVEVPAGACRSRSSSGSAARGRFASTCGWSRPPTATCRRWSTSRRVPQRPLLPAQRLSDRQPAAAGAAGRHRRAGAALHAEVRADG